MITPEPLTPGARVALIAPASPVPMKYAGSSSLPEQVEQSVEALRSYGLDPVVCPSCLEMDGYLAGSDSLRAQDVMNAFLDDTIQGIFCIRGGYGVQRILPLLDFDQIGAHPKWFAGYSDITALHIVLNQVCHLVTYHTPMPSTEIRKGLDSYTDEYLRRAMFSNLQGDLPCADSCTARSLVCGCAEGILAGGNLSLVSSSLGTPYEIDARGKILFLEDIGEAPYRIDGMLNHLRLAGKLDECAGIVLGAYTDCQAEKPEESLSLTRIFQDLIVPSGKPAIMDYTCGHCLPSMSLPMGARVRLDASGCRLNVL